MKNFLLIGLFFVSTLSSNANNNNYSALSHSNESTEASTLACTTCTKLIVSQCGATLASVSTSILASPVTSATNYRFEITKGASVTVLESGTNRSFTLTQSAGLAAYNTTYSVRVAVKISGVWDDYGIACSVTTPALPGLTKVVASQCGITLANATTPVLADEVFGATTYRFEVSNGETVIGTVNAATRTFQMTQVTGLAYSTQYSVRVATNNNGFTYGTPCNITIPASNTQTKVVSGQCGVTVPLATTQINADQVFQATAYRFEVTNGATVRFVQNVNRFFNLSQLSGGAAYGTTYSIRVAVVFQGTLQLYGPPCTVTLPPLTKLIPSQCNANLSAVASPIWASLVPSASAYRFQVTKGASVSVFETTNRYFQLTLLPSGVAAYNTTYSIKAAYKFNGTWLPYGDACTLTTPVTVTATKLIDSQCNSAIASFSTPILANEVFGASSYSFEVTQGANVNVGQSNTRSFLLSKLPGLIYGVPCSVRVAVTFNSVLQPYGTACVVTPPSTVGTTQLIASQCGATLATINTPILVNEVYLATDYRFEVTEGANVRTYETTLRYFLLSQLVGGGAPSTTYAVRAAVKFNGVWQDFGPSCNVTTPAASISRMNNSLVNTNFAVKAFPNPFASQFKLDIESASDSVVEVKVYDMIGRQLEIRKGTVSELSSQEVGANYPRGVYNVLVSQGENVKSIRMIKR
ncbi:T9SS type A sorting domain-containing protein [Flavobacterium luteum]|uniref:T9SS type A sorting domain-containing protein n=1 Tax=Flavobacterium luteum TaxID=2026654 RepID=A0A7J5ADG2_9FLAO|nr:T9SS type A sorting domain-containing protein [Flavobacterium luteum]KAB1155602.1 T9SS type A sorting domain-containing protein [Flavobacterium luteum]